MSTKELPPIRPYASGWAQIKSKVDIFFDNVELGMNVDTFKIPAKEYIAIYEYEEHSKIIFK